MNPSLLPVFYHFTHKQVRSTTGFGVFMHKPLGFCGLLSIGKFTVRGFAMVEQAAANLELSWRNLCVNCLTQLLVHSWFRRP